MKQGNRSLKRELKIILLAILFIMSIGIAVYFNFVLYTAIVYSHFFYIPTILACLWWRYKGMLVPLLLAFMVVFFPFFSGTDLMDLDNIIRGSLLIGIGTVVSVLSTQISKGEDQLRGKVQELNCLYGIITQINNPTSSIDEILKGTLEKIRCAWQHPQHSCARITLHQDEYKTGNFEETPWKITREVRLINDKTLKIEINYLEKFTFTNDEENFLKEILEQLKAVFDLKLAWIK